MTTTINRNDPCICGSGKKYKKCCIHKDSVVQIQEVRLNRFVEQKNSLIENLREFIHSETSPSLLKDLEVKFNQRFEVNVGEKQKKQFFQFWVYFFHRFENKLRGIEWFFNENSNRLSPGEKKLILTWTNLPLRLVQAIQFNSEHVEFKDVFTNELFSVPNDKEQISEAAPWFGTLALLEPFDSRFSFNGVRLMVGPKQIAYAKDFINKLVEKTNEKLDTILELYYPEILSKLFETENEFSNEEKSLTEYVVKFEVEDEDAAIQYLYYDSSIVIDSWTEAEKNLSWTGNWYRYEDSELTGNVHIADVFGKIILNGSKITFSCFEKQKLTQFKKFLLKKLSFTIVDEKTNTIKVPKHIELKNTIVKLDDDVPKYFSMYAQNSLLLNVDAPILKLKNKSLKELALSGQIDVAETWLKDSEYALYLATTQQFGEIKTTADYNTVRKTLELPLSPFVTSGRTRYSQLTEGQPVVKKQLLLNKHDIPFLEALGFTPDTVDTFYTRDILSYYKEKASGKSENTIKKYRENLYHLRALLEKSSVVSWEECSIELWKEVMVHYYVSFEVATKTALKDFTSVLRTFLKWKRNDLPNVAALNRFIEEEEEQLISAAQLKNSLSQGMPGVMLFTKAVKGKLKVDGAAIEGLFEIIKLDQTTVRVVEIVTKKQYTIRLEDSQMRFAQIGLLIGAKLIEGNLNYWEIVNVKDVFPRIAKEFIKIN